jgi:hypothetical protein
MNLTKYFFNVFLNLVLLSRVNPSNVTYKEVTLVHLAQLKGLAHAQVVTLVGIVSRRISRAS